MNLHLLWPKKIYQWTPHGRGRKERAQQLCKRKMTKFIRSRNMKTVMAKDKLLWCLGKDKWLVAVKNLIIIIIIIIIIK